MLYIKLLTLVVHIYGCDVNRTHLSSNVSFALFSTDIILLSSVFMLIRFFKLYLNYNNIKYINDEFYNYSLIYLCHPANVAINAKS